MPFKMWDLDWSVWSLSSVVQENAAMLFYCEVPEMFCEGFEKFHLTLHLLRG